MGVAVVCGRGGTAGGGVMVGAVVVEVAVVMAAAVVVVVVVWWWWWWWWEWWWPPCRVVMPARWVFRRSTLALANAYLYLCSRARAQIKPTVALAAESQVCGYALRVFARELVDKLGPQEDLEAWMSVLLCAAVPADWPGVPVPVSLCVCLCLCVCVWMRVCAAVGV